MKRTFHFGRKTRQLKYRIKLLIKQIKVGLKSASIEKLLTEILSLKRNLSKFDVRTYRALLSVSASLLLIPNVNAQQVFKPSVDQIFNIYDNEEFERNIIIRYLFIDTDGDGDEDCFFETVPALFDSSSRNEIYFQENVSDGIVKFTNPQLIFQDRELIQTINPFTLADIDNDGDFDLFRSGQNPNNPYESAIKIIENNSNSPNSFDFTETQTLPIVDEMEIYGVINTVNLDDLDQDGDLDLILNIYDYSTASGNYAYTNTFIFFENNGGAGTNPFEDNIEAPFNLKQITNLLSNSTFQNNVAGVHYMFKDIDSDGDKDLLYEYKIDLGAFDSDSSKIGALVFENTGQGTAFFETDYQEFFLSELYWFSIGITGDDQNFVLLNFSDIDNDGDLDILDNVIGSTTYYDTSYIAQSYYRNRLNFTENISNEATRIKGIAYLDENTNQTFDGNDVLLPNQTIVVEPNNIILTTNSIGEFDAFLGQGNYELSINTPPAWNAQPGSHQITLDNLPDTISNLNFALQPESIQQDVRIDGIGGITRRGFDTNYKIKYSNLGSTTESGVISAQFDEDISVISTDPNAVNVFDNTYEWNFINLTPFETRYINITSNVTLDASLGDTLCSVFRITPVENDIARTNNTDTLKQIVIGSFDPNDKLVQPLGSSENGSTHPSTELFTYTVRFQNTGTDTAFRVIVIDTIDTNFDVTTFEMVDASHPYSFYLEDRKATWTFDNILLPDSTVDYDGSNGYIQYDIQPIDNQPLGTVFTNDAYIYFDFNEPVKTNTTLNTFEITLGILQRNSLTFELFPNPTAQLAILQFENANYEKAILEIYDQSGKLVFMDEGFENEFLITKNQLASGIYSFTLKLGNERGHGKLIFTN
ncbi:MAG: T9SS type A sorting domain-containing protein [Chitinophagales bacterium]